MYLSDTPPLDEALNRIKQIYAWPFKASFGSIIPELFQICSV
jgi:hypothetical protein